MWLNVYVIGLNAYAIGVGLIVGPTCEMSKNMYG